MLWFSVKCTLKSFMFEQLYVNMKVFPLLIKQKSSVRSDPLAFNNQVVHVRSQKIIHIKRCRKKYAIY